ncbi:MAG: hypothetical protein U0R26_00910 [Solirubrobacterales bacterium]
MQQALEGIEKLRNNVDTLIIVPNEKLLQAVERRTSVLEAFRQADDILRQGVQGITDLITIPGLINLELRRRADDHARRRLGPDGRRLGLRRGAGAGRRQGGDHLAADRGVDQRRDRDAAQHHRP